MMRRLSKRNLLKKFQILDGFTLIELLVVMSVMAILSAIGIAAFVEYSHIQAVNSAVLGVETMLQTARSDALSQITARNGSNQPLCSNGYSLTGYEVQICPSGSTNCGDYKLNVTCGGSDLNSFNPIESKNLPNNPHLYFTDSGSFTFSVLTGGVNSGTITIANDYGISNRTITVFSNGSISAQ